MKLFLSLIIISASLFIGYCTRKKLHEREKFFADLLHVIDILKIDISFFKTSLTSCIQKYNNDLNGLTKQMFTNYIKYLNDNSYNKNLSDFIKLDFLTTNEAETIKNLLLFIGSSDAITQCEMLDNYKILISNYHEESQKKYNKYGNLALKLSLSLGLIIVILTI